MSKYNITVMSEDEEPRFLDGDAFLAIACTETETGTRCCVAGEINAAALGAVLSRNEDLLAAARVAVLTKLSQEMGEEDNAAN